MPEIPRADVAALLKKVSSNVFLNRELSSICQLNGLTSSGVKASLQNRIANLIQETVNRQDLTRFRQIEQSIRNIRPNGNTTSLTKSPNQYHNSNIMPASALRNPTAYSNGYGQNGVGSAIQNGTRGGGPPLHFKHSPFYDIHSGINTRTCPPMDQHRTAVTLRIRADNPMLQQCVHDKTLRVMIFCAGDKNGPQDIAFPHQSEIKVNDADVKANLRGLKNKPGSTRPVDITDLLRLRPASYENKIDFTYALTTKSFHLAINLCRVRSVQDLAAKIKAGKRIPKASVVQELNRKGADADIVTTSQVLSLKCPLSYMRLVIPCRSFSCTHIQCFDATSYLQLQEQGPQWLCPICNKSAPFDALAVDEYVRDILDNTPLNLEQVTIEPDGQWKVASEARQKRPQRPVTESTTLSDDEIEISEVSVVGGRKLATPAGLSAQNTPNSAPRSYPSTSNKRPAPHDVVDLTLDSDSDDGPPPPKKQYVPPAYIGQPHYYPT